MKIGTISLFGAALALVAYSAGCGDDESSSSTTTTTTTSSTSSGMGGTGSSTNSSSTSTTTTTTGGGMGGNGGSGGGMASFCGTFESTCGYGMTGRFADANTCMTYYNAAGSGCKSCLDDHLANAVNIGTTHCSHACGEGPCAGPCTAEGDGCMQ